MLYKVMLLIIFILFKQEHKILNHDKFSSHTKSNLQEFIFANDSGHVTVQLP